MRATTIPRLLGGLLRAVALPLGGRRDPVRDPRTARAFPHGRLAAALIGLAAMGLSGFTGGGPRAAVASPDPHAGALCFGRLDMHERVAPFATDRWEICYRRGAGMARLRVRGDAGTDIDCVVYAPDERVVARDDDPKDLCVLEWRPRASGNYRLEVHNFGDRANAYALYTR